MATIPTRPVLDDAKSAGEPEAARKGGMVGAAMLTVGGLMVVGVLLVVIVWLALR